MSAQAPLVSILITTYNRSRLLRRAIHSVLMQDFADYELVIIDDCSPDDTREVIATINDPRIRYIRNETNVGSKEGDRAILRRFVYELMLGKYFVYLCDDDYWLFPDLLSRQVDVFKKNDNVAMVMGGQLAYFLSTPESYFGHPADNPMQISSENLEQFFDLATRKTKSQHFYFHGADKPLFPEGVLTPEFFLTEFAKEPTTKNIIGGAMLYSRELFIRSGALRSLQGSQWQAGYELKIGPACYGNTVYFDEPSIVTEIRDSNASFQRTQVEHYLDSITSVEVAFATPLTDPALADRWRFLRRVKAETIRHLSFTFLNNALIIRRHGSLGLCSAENMSKALRLRDVLPVLARNRVLPGMALLRTRTAIEMERLGGGLLRRRLRLINARLTARAAAARSTGNGLSRAAPRVELAFWNGLRVLWRTLPQRVRKALLSM